MKKQHWLVVFLLVVASLVIGVTMFTRNNSKQADNSEESKRAVVEAEMKQKLPTDVFEVMYQEATEPRNSSELLNEKRPGTYVTADTGLPVFRSDEKYESGSGWPSFYDAISDNIELKEDTTFFIKRTEVVSKDTGAHLGHVFTDGPEPTGLRYCINGLALKFIPDEEEN